MDGLIGVSARRSNLYNSNLAIQKIGMFPPSNVTKLQVVGYYESSVSGASTVLGTGTTSPPMYLKAGDVIYIMGCEGYIGSTTTATAATTFTNQGRVPTTWQPSITNQQSGTQTFATYTEAAMLNARQNQWSTSNFASTDWALTGPGGTTTLGTYKAFLALKIIVVTNTGMYRINTGTGPRGTGRSSTCAHVYCIAFRGIDTNRLATTYFEPFAGDIQFIKSTKSRISTGTYAVGVTSTPDDVNAFDDSNIYTHALTESGSSDRIMYIGMIPELDLISDQAAACKKSYDGWISGLWSDQYDGAGGFSTMCGLYSNPTASYTLTRNHSGVPPLTATLVASSFYGIVLPSL